MLRASLLYIVLAGALMWITSGPAYGVSAAEIQAGKAAAPVAASLADDALGVAADAGRILYVPVGVGEMLLSPLPGVSAASGLKHIGRGIMGPVEAAVKLVKLPFALVRGPVRHPAGIRLA